jgi:hypothetical protein
MYNTYKHLGFLIAEALNLVEKTSERPLPSDPDESVKERKRRGDWSTDSDKPSITGSRPIKGAKLSSFEYSKEKPSGPKTPRGEQHELPRSDPKTGKRKPVSPETKFKGYSGR